MRYLYALACFGMLTSSLSAEIKRQERTSKLDNEPGAIYLSNYLDKPLRLKTTKAVTVYSDTGGKNRIGAIPAGETVTLEAVTDKIFRVRGKLVSGWCGPWAFSCDKDPDFVAHLKSFHERQTAVEQLIAAKQVVVGMTAAEVGKSRGKPTKTTVRKTDKGESGKWEYIDYEEVKNYVTRIDPRTGATYRQLASVERVEKGRTNVEFTDGIVSAVEQSESNDSSNVRIIVPPLVFGW